jgi:four helix bundle protein
LRGVSGNAAVNVQPKDIRVRSFEYGLRAIRLYQFLQKGRDGAGWILGKQYLRAACSVGANIEEAQASESRADFIHKLGIAQKEARESLYWLRLLSQSEIVVERKLRPLIQETEELVRVVTSIVVNSKRRWNGKIRAGEFTIHNSLFTIRN